jgi:DNA-binding NarL/FixJ family response regulator
MKKTRILIADDHSMIRQGIRAVITALRDCELCGEAENGRALLTLALKHQPDLVVMDISMPKLNGLETTRLLHRQSPDTRVLILTMHDSETLADEIIKAGAHGYLLKSDAAELLPKAIEAVAAGRNFLSPRLSHGHSRKNQETLPAPGTNETFRARLTPRERQIVQLLAEGKSNKETADALAVTLGTIETHRKNIFTKLQLHNTAELVRYAIRNQFIQA